jgi:hypothetical protein
MKRIETTPPELAEYGIFFEKVDFRFESPVRALFWIEVNKGKEKPLIHEVPHDHVDPTTHYILTYVQTTENGLALSATTDSPPPLNRRTGGTAIFEAYTRRNIIYKPTDRTIPLGRDFEIFEIKWSPDWRHHEAPVPFVRIWAHFSQ